METFIINSLSIVGLNFMLLSMGILILAYFGWFPKPEWMQRYIDRKK